MKTLHMANYFAVLLIIGLILFTSNMYGQRASQSKSGLVKKTTNQQTSDEYLKTAEEYLADGKLDLAITAFTKAIRFDSQNANAYNGRGYAYHIKGNHNLAIRDLTKAISINPKDYNFYMNRAVVYQRIKKFSLAIKDYSKVIAIDPEYGNAYKGRSECYEATGRKNLAKGDEKKALEFGFSVDPVESDLLPNQISTSTPKDQVKPEDFYKKARDFYIKRDFEGAIRELTKAIELSPQTVDYYWLRGDAYVELKDYASAIKDYTKIIELKPQDAKFYYHRGKAYLDNKNIDAAFADFSKAIELGPKFSQAYHYRGSINFIRRDYEAAVKDYTKVIELEPQISVPYSNRAAVYEAMGKTDLAAADRQKAEDAAARKIPVKPGFSEDEVEQLFNLLEQSDKFKKMSDKEKADAYSSLGIKFMVNNNNDAAIKAYSKQIELNPTWESAYVDRGDIYVRKGDYDAAINDYSKSIQLNKYSGEFGKNQFTIAYHARGRAKFLKMEYEAAISDYTKAIEYSPAYSELYINRAKAYEALGKKELAEADIKRARELNQQK